MNENKTIPVPHGDKFVIEITTASTNVKLESTKEKKFERNAAGLRTLIIGDIIFQFSMMMIIILILLITGSKVIDTESEIVNINDITYEVVFNDKFDDPALWGLKD